jgi:hydrogenase large subunit
MANRIVVDPITRIEGHLRAEVEITDGTIREAFCLLRWFVVSKI